MDLDKLFGLSIEKTLLDDEAKAQKLILSEMRAFHFEMQKTADCHSNLSVLGIDDWRISRKTCEMCTFHLKCVIERPLSGIFQGFLILSRKVQLFSLISRRLRNSQKTKKGPDSATSYASSYVSSWNDNQSVTGSAPLAWSILKGIAYLPWTLLRMRCICFLNFRLPEIVKWVQMPKGGRDFVRFWNCTKHCFLRLFVSFITCTIKRFSTWKLF